MVSEARKRIIIISPVVFVLYLVLGTEPLQVDLLPIPIAIRQIPELLESSVPRRDGEIQASVSLPPGVAQEGKQARYITETGKLGDSGNPRRSIDTVGIPFISGGRQFLIRQDQSGVLEFNETGRILWEKEFSSIMTCFAATRNLIVAGSLDGRILALGNEGQTLLDMIPGESRIPVVYGLAISENNSRIAVIFGLYPQIVMILEKRKDSYRELFRLPLNLELRRQIPCSFLDGGDVLVFERSGGVAILDVRKKALDFRPSESMASTFESNISQNCVAFLSGNFEETRLKIYGSGAMILADIPFHTRDAILHSESVSLYLRTGNTEMQYTMETR